MVLVIFEKCIQRIVSTKKPHTQKNELQSSNHSYTKHHLANNSLSIIVVLLSHALQSFYSQMCCDKASLH